MSLTNNGVLRVFVSNVIERTVKSMQVTQRGNSEYFVMLNQYEQVIVAEWADRSHISEEMFVEEMLTQAIDNHRLKEIPKRE